jgi:hypothetical protein
MGLPTAEGRTGLDRITHLTVYAKDGFGPAEVRAIQAIRALVWPPGGTEGPGTGPRDARFGRGSLSLVLVGMGDPKDFGECPLFGSSRRWNAATP